MDKEKIQDLIEKGFSQKEIANTLDITQTNLKYWMEKFGLGTKEKNIKPKKMTPVKAIQDDSGHWHIMPNSMVEDFYRDGHDEDFIDSGEFDNKYGQYRTGGDLNLLQLYAEI